MNNTIKVADNILTQAIHDYWSDVHNAAKEYIDTDNTKTAKQLSVLHNVLYNDLLIAARKLKRKR